MSGGSVYKRPPEPVPARTFTPTAWGFGTGNQLVFVGTLAAFTASNPNIDPPLPPSSSNTPAQRASNARARSSMLPGARRDLANVDRDSPPHPAAAQPLPPTPAARPTTPRSRHRLACRQFLLGMQAGCGAERPAGGRVRQGDRCTPGRACPAGSVRRSTAELRSGRAPAPRRTCRQPTVRKDRRHRNRPAIGGKGVGTVDGQGRGLRALGSGLRRRPRPPGVGVTSGRCACSRRAATRKRWIPSLLATPSSYSAR